MSIVMPVHNPHRAWLEEAVHSVMNQRYGRWQLCLCDDASSEPWVIPYLRGLALGDSRIRYASLLRRAGISGALNEAGRLVSGDYIGFLDQDDLLAPEALQAIVEELQKGPADIIYSDEDYIDAAGRPVRPNLKPGWSPDLLLSCMYMGHFLVVSRAAVERVGWFRGECDGAQDYDLALRLTDGAAAVRHVPRILYHWRQHPGSSSTNHDAKPYAIPASLRSLSDAAIRRGWKARVERGRFPNTYSVKRELQSYPPVSVIICSRNSRLLKRCLTSLRASTRYPDWEAVVVQHSFGGSDPNLARVAETAGCSTALYDGPFNFSRMNNLGAAKARGDLLILLNDDTEPIGADWLERMAAQLVREEVGVVGACLLYPSGMVQHAGVVAGMGDGAGHPGRGFALDGNDFWPWLSLSRNVTAVTGACLGIRKTVFDRLGGMDPDFPNNYNDVDLCLRAARDGLMVIYEAGAMLRHRECATRSRGTGAEERKLFHDRWGYLLSAADPYYSPMLRSDTEAVMLRDPAEAAVPAPLSGVLR
jgi:GT2 family glycosyltransferase